MDNVENGFRKWAEDNNLNYYEVNKFSLFNKRFCSGFTKIKDIIRGEFQGKRIYLFNVGSSYEMQLFAVW